jgi:hypothetical protein
MRPPLVQIIHQQEAKQLWWRRLQLYLDWFHSARSLRLEHVVELAARNILDAIATAQPAE